MSTLITVTWQRAGVPQSPNVISMQIENMSIQQSAYYGGDAPYFRYNAIVETLYYKFQFKDLLIDTKNNDPTTGQLAKYRIISVPEEFDDNHVEFVVDRMVGT